MVPCSNLGIAIAQAEAIRAAAAAEKKTISDYVYDLHAGRWRPAELLQFDLDR